MKSRDCTGRKTPVNRLRAILVLVTLLASVSTPAFELNLPVTYDTLANGLRYLIVRDSTVAVVSCRLYYFVGSMYEGPGTSGLSHMYEHMMFKGTRRVGTADYRKERPLMRRIDSLDNVLQRLRSQGAADTSQPVLTLKTQIAELLSEQRKYLRTEELWDLYQTNGGTQLNAWTADEITAYIVTLPANKVELFYWLESDRMRQPVLRELPSEREVVAEERRMRYENRPVNRYWERLFALFYVAHPYRQPTIGWMSDIMAYTRPKLEQHVRRFYTPDNALIVLAGNIEPVKAARDLKRYFGGIPRAAVPKEEAVTREPPPIGETRFTVRDRAEPRIDVFFHTPGYPHDDLYALDVLEGVLSGRSGRLYRALVTERRLCTDAGAENAVRLHDGYFRVYALPKQGAHPDTVERVLREELARLTREPPSDREIERIKNNIRMSFVTGLTSLEGISDRLAWFERLRSWRDLMTYPRRIAAVRAGDVPVVAGRYFRPEFATVGRLLPAESGGITSAASPSPEDQ